MLLAYCARSQAPHSSLHSKRTFWLTVRALKHCIHRCIPSEPVHVLVDRRPQQAVPGFYAGRCPDIRRRRSVKDVFIDIRQNANAEYSEIYKMTEELVNIAGTMISTPKAL